MRWHHQGLFWNKQYQDLSLLFRCQRLLASFRSGEVKVHVFYTFVLLSNLLKMFQRDRKKPNRYNDRDLRQHFSSSVYFLLTTHFLCDCFIFVQLEEEKNFTTVLSCIKKRPIFASYVPLHNVEEKEKERGMFKHIPTRWSEAASYQTDQILVCEDNDKQIRKYSKFQWFISQKANNKSAILIMQYCCDRSKNWKL